MRQNKRPGRKMPEKVRELSLIPSWAMIILWCVSLALPNIIYSGIKFADTLHILKWAVAGVPVAIAVIIASSGIMRSSTLREKLKLDIFALLWMVILAYCMIMLLWTDISSPTAFWLELVCFTCVWAFYVLSVNAFPSWGLPVIVVSGAINSAVNVLFAELQIRGLNSLAFLRSTPFSSLEAFASIILPTPANYIGNTAQQNMFGLWSAVNSLGSVAASLFPPSSPHSSPPLPVLPSLPRPSLIPSVSVAASVFSLKYAVIMPSNDLFAVAALFLAMGFVLAFVLRFRGNAPSCGEFLGPHELYKPFCYNSPRSRFNGAFFCYCFAFSPCFCPEAYHGRNHRARCSFHGLVVFPPFRTDCSENS